MISKLKDANVFIEGNSMLGIAEEIDLPNLEADLSDHNALGMIGVIQTMNRFNALLSRIKWNSQDNSVAKYAWDFMTTYNFQVRTYASVYTSNPEQNGKTIVNYMRARFSSNGAGNFAPATDIDNTESNLVVEYFKQVIDGVTVIEVDILKSVYKVMGVDMLAKRNSALGI